MSVSKPLETKSIDAQHIASFGVAGLTVLTANDQGQATADINALWQRFFEEGVLHRIQDRTENVIYAVYSDYQGDHTKPFRVTLGCKIEPSANAPAGFHKVIVPAAHYAIFAARGEQPQSLLNTWETIWKSNLPRSFKTDLEIYGPRFFEDGLHEILVCIGVDHVADR